MAAYRQVYDSRHLQSDYQEPGSAPEPYARQLSTGYLFMAFWGISKSYNRPVLYIKKASNIYATIAFIKSAPTPLLSFSFLLVVFLSRDEVQIAQLASFADVVADTHGVQRTEKAGSSR